jgi:hypothetical protein
VKSFEGDAFALEQLMLARSRAGTATSHATVAVFCGNRTAHPKVPNVTVRSSFPRSPCGAEVLTIERFAAGAGPLDRAACVVFSLRSNSRSRSSSGQGEMSLA